MLSGEVSPFLTFLFRDRSTAQKMFSTKNIFSKCEKLDFLCSECCSIFDVVTDSKMKHKIAASENYDVVC